MAREFTVKEANQVISHHKKLLSSLNDTAAASVRVNNRIKQAAQRLITNGTLKNAILRDCENISDITRTADVEALICALYEYQKVSPAVKAAQTLQNNYPSSNITNNIDLLNPGPIGLSWLFMGKRGKEASTQAYHELCELLNSSYGQLVPRLADEVEAAKYVPTGVAWAAFEEDSTAFRQILQNTFYNNYHTPENSRSNPFFSLIRQYEQIKSNVALCDGDTLKEKRNIESAANRMLANEALNVLRAIPVEEINRDRAGFRIKPLRDAGFTTMADIYAAHIYQLEALHGISENAAYSIKRFATKCLEEAQCNVKIKLSADERNKHSTALVQAIYTFRSKQARRKELREFIWDHEDTLELAKKTCSAVRDGLPWLFYSAAQRDKLRDAYRQIDSAVNGAYAAKVNRLASILLEKEPSSASTAWADFQQNSIDYLSILEDIVPGMLGNDDNLYGLPEDLAREIQDEVFFPDGLLCTLRRYQEWGVKYILHQKRVLLGDEMGLGKTVQAIATMVSLKNTGGSHFMVICPASVVTNWCREIVKHSKLRVTKIHGSGRSQALKSWIWTGGVAVTTYETTAYFSPDDIKNMDLIVVDEAHYIKNPEARRTINVKRLCKLSERLLFMTGTALENKVEEMVALIEVLQPRIADSVKDLMFMSSAPQFRNRVSPVYYRRKREDVLTELPKLIESKEWCVLNREEKAKYERNVLAKNYAACRRLSWDGDDLKKSCKAIRLLELIEMAKSEDRKVLVFSFFLDTIRAVGGLLGTRCYGPINGSIPPQRRQEIIDSFDKAPAGSVLMAQIQSGGTGLNIQSASVVVICEPQFKPSIENQAISRAYRMGQSRNVLVYRLLCENTIDEKLTDLLEQKQRIFDEFADKSVAAQQNAADYVEVDEKKFGQLIQEEIDRINAEKVSATTSSHTEGAESL